ncbi:MAG: type II secretion system minor pseudopilin GspJ [Candidatus Contendobacter sp.]|nr:type II secretion system minor pseudopilin GspJ [Candidatus Contendobacter sp.]
MNKPTRGFTLLELLVALAVFSIMAVAAYGGLRNVLYTRAAVEEQNRRLAAVQLAVYRLEQDIEQAVPRGIRDEYGEPQGALLGGALADDRLTLTRTGWDNPLGQPRANLQRVAYRLRDGRLWRLATVLAGARPGRSDRTARDAVAGSGTGIQGAVSGPGRLARRLAAALVQRRRQQTGSRSFAARCGNQSDPGGLG